ncbi:MAG: hypothetical protein RBU25_19935 [Lentisphaeria bacterium]|jgi:hypothetical protein|nr:hypothetical protein [Lentisphaeria bacterium]
MTDKSATIDPIFRELAKPFGRDAYKEVRLGRTFTTIDAYHIVERLTQVFGLCGTGWGVEVTEWREYSPHCVACIGHLWYDSDGKRCLVPAVGDAQIMTDKKGNVQVAEAFKKAQTNLISKAASFLGVGLSVYQGKGIDDPYLDREAMLSGGGNGGGRPAQRRTPDVPGPALDPDAPSGRVATSEDWQAIKIQCDMSGLSREELRAILAEGPFCCGDRPTDLLAVHVPTLLDRIAAFDPGRANGAPGHVDLLEEAQA